MPRKGYQSVSLKTEILEILDKMPGESRSEKLERLINEADLNLRQARSRREGEPQSVLLAYIMEKIPSWERSQVWDLLKKILNWLEIND